MTVLDLRADFSRFRAANPRRINLAAHSHHEWPDVTFEAQMRCWDDAARLAGDKWRLVFDEVLPSVQRGIAAILNLPDPSTITIHRTPTNSCAASCPALQPTAPFAFSPAMPNFTPFADRWRALRKTAWRPALT
jgi:hypothetical protein